MKNPPFFPGNVPEVQRPTELGQSIPSSRTLWAIRRAALESIHAKSQPKGGNFKRRWELFEQLIKVFGLGLKASGLYRRGVQNALNLRLQKHDLHFPNLPSRFDGYRILHLTDLHLDFLPGIDDSMVRAIHTLDGPVDLAIFTGDFRERVDSGYKQIVPPLAKVLGAIQAKDGVFTTLGNHDTVNMVPTFEAMGMRVLTNETITLRRHDEEVIFTGIDDVHYYYTEQALEAIRNTPDRFKMLFAHSAELYHPAATAGYDLYLAGHTHGGQICLPGGHPVITHHTAGRKRASGFWREGKMIGYTSPGAGTIALPVRYFSPGEVTLFTLRKQPS